MRIIISSAGRRVYLVQWFQEALRQANIGGQVIVLDHDPHAAAAALADEYRHIPAFTSPDYAPSLFELVDELSPDLFISLNDYELTELAEGLAEDLRSRGIVVPVLDTESHRAVADKFLMAQTLQQAGISTPTTVLLSNQPAVQELLATATGIIVKDRFGSGSSGLRRFTTAQARQWVKQHYDGELAGHHLDQLIMQPDMGGSEYGLDVITHLRGGPVEGVLARRKLGMRNGETSSAMTVKNTRFIGVAAALNAALGIRGSVDVDVIIDAEGVPNVIDINPRFGGGYPFNHIAGANLPHFYLASTLRKTPQPGWDTYQHGYVGAKHEGIIGFDPSQQDEQHLTRQNTALRI